MIFTTPKHHAEYTARSSQWLRHGRYAGSYAGAKIAPAEAYVGRKNKAGNGTQTHEERRSLKLGIKELRTLHGVGQSAIVDRMREHGVKCSVPALSQTENGKGAWPASRVTFAKACILEIVEERRL